MTTTHTDSPQTNTPDDDVIASGDKVRLRLKRLADARADYSWRRDETLARYDAARALKQPYEGFLANFRDELLHPHNFRRTFGVESLAGEHIGNVMYYNIDHSRGEAELGVTIGHTAYWGRGYGTQAVRLLVRYIFDTTPLNRIYLHTLDWNVRAQRAFASAGFRDCGPRRRGPHRFHRMEIRRPTQQDTSPETSDEPASSRPSTGPIASD